MKKGTYVDGFVLTVPKKRAAEYRKMATEGSKIWKKFGALDYKECVIDDEQPKTVTFTFPKMAKAKKGEQVWFSYIVYKSRTHRDAVSKKVMAYFSKQFANGDFEMPNDPKKMAYGGFKAMVKA